MNINFAAIAASANILLLIWVHVAILILIPLSCGLADGHPPRRCVADRQCSNQLNATCNLSAMSLGGSKDTGQFALQEHRLPGILPPIRSLRDKIHRALCQSQGPGLQLIALKIYNGPLPP